jgi:hypothetical protein
MPLAGVAVWRLRVCYRVEPADWSGWWQLRLADLLVVSFFTGFLLLLAQRCLADHFLDVGLPVSFGAGVGLLLGLLVAARRGFTRWQQKYLFGVGFALWAFGQLSVGALAVCLVALWIAHTEPSDVFLEVVGLRSVGRTGVGGLLLRAGLLSLPAGWLLCRLTKWWADSGRGRDDTRASSRGRHERG